jgi:hypothetical protein
VYHQSVIHHDQSQSSRAVNTYSVAAWRDSQRPNVAAPRSHIQNAAPYTESVVHNDNSYNSHTRNTYSTVTASESRRSAHNMGNYYYFS